MIFMVQEGSRVLNHPLFSGRGGEPMGMERLNEDNPNSGR